MSGYNRYIPPLPGDINFDFTTTSGYEAPNARDLAVFFDGRPAYQASAYLQARINVMGSYQTSTYTYLKECPTVIVGFSDDGIQKMSLPCIYGGIRDTGAYVKVRQTTAQDIWAEIYPQSDKTWYEGQADLAGRTNARYPQSLDLRIILHGRIYEIQRQLTAAIKALHREDEYDVGGFLRTTFPTYRDLSNLSIRGHSLENQDNVRSTITGMGSGTIDVLSRIRGWDRENIRNLKSAVKSLYVENEVQFPGYLKQTFDQTLDLSSIYIKSTEFRYADLRNIIKGYKLGVEIEFPGFLRPTETATKELEAYLKQTTEQYLDLKMKIRGFAYEWPIDFPGIIQGWQEVVLSAEVSPKLAANLAAAIVCIYTIDFPASLTAVSPVYLAATLTPWHVKNISASILAVYGANDIQASISAITPIDLSAQLVGFGGVALERNLGASVSSYYARDLAASIGFIPSVDLQAYIMAKGSFKDLACYIVPKVVHVKRFIEVALLEHKDLISMINTSCFGSSIKDLSSYILPKNKKDLGGSVFGWGGDNIVHLNASINTADIIVLDSMVVGITDTNTSANFNFSVKKPVVVADTLVVQYGNYGVKSLACSISAATNSGYSDLSSILNAVINISYSSDPFAEHQGRETVINIAKNEERWEREIEMFFSEAARRYFYVDGENKIYKNDRSKRWVLRVVGFEYASDARIERGKVRAKYIFNLEDYASIDAAIIDAIDRVSMFRRSNLGASITPSGGVKRLGARINPLGYRRKSYRAFSASITASP